jgi:hypothetical protein
MGDNSPVFRPIARQMARLRGSVLRLRALWTPAVTAGACSVLLFGVAQAQATVSRQKPPVITAVSVSPSRLPASGGTVTITARVDHASMCVLRGTSTPDLSVRINKGATRCGSGRFRRTVVVSKSIDPRAESLTLVISAYHSPKLDSRPSASHKITVLIAASATLNTSVPEHFAGDPTLASYIGPDPVLGGVEESASDLASVNKGLQSEVVNSAVDGWNAFGDFYSGSVIAIIASTRANATVVDLKSIIKADCAQDKGVMSPLRRVGSLPTGFESTCVTSDSGPITILCSARANVLMLDIARLTPTFTRAKLDAFAIREYDRVPAGGVALQASGASD